MYRSITFIGHCWAPVRGTFQVFFDDGVMPPYNIVGRGIKLLVIFACDVDASISGEVTCIIVTSLPVVLLKQHRIVWTVTQMFHLFRNFDTQYLQQRIYCNWFDTVGLDTGKLFGLSQPISVEVTHSVSTKTGCRSSSGSNKGGIISCCNCLA